MDRKFAALEAIEAKRIHLVIGHRSVLTVDLFSKGSSQEKTLLRRKEFFLLRSPLD